jgi:hypothetical protein
MKYHLFTLFICVMLGAVSCTGQGNPATKNKTTAALPEPTEDQVRERGLIRQIEDSGYPFVNLTIEFPERQFEENFVLNLEEVENVDQATINKWVGKYVTFNYTSNITNALLDVRMDGASLLGMSDEDLPEEVQKITGVLSGASEVTTGDLPVLIRITDPHERSLSFEFFVTEEMVNAEGMIVEGFFQERTSNTIMAITLVGK